MKIRLKSLKKYLILLNILFTALGLYFYLINYRQTKAIIIQKTLSQEEILARTASSAVENLIKNVQNQLSAFVFSFTEENAKESFNIEKTRAEFDSYIQRSQLPINGIALYDQKGTLLILGNRIHDSAEEGQNFFQTAFIRWSAKPDSKNKTYISAPYIGTTGASKGQIILIIAKPVYFASQYRGTLVIKLLINNFIKEYIGPLISGSSESSFIIDANGLVLASNNPSLLNKNLFGYAKEKKWKNYQDFSQKLRLAINSDSLETEWTFANPSEKPTDSLVAVSKIDIPDSDKDLYFVLSTPQSNSIGSLKLIRAYGVALAISLLTTTIASLFILIFRLF